MHRFRVAGVAVVAAAALGAAIAGFASAAGEDGDTAAAAVAFAPGIDHAEALVRLHVAQATGRDDPAMSPADTLPDGVVALIPDDPGGSVVIDPAAPFGWDTEFGIPVSATYMLPGSADDLVRDDTGPWPAGARLVIPDLPDCMVRTTRTAGGEECGEDDVVSVATTLPLP